MEQPDFAKKINNCYWEFCWEGYDITGIPSAEEAADEARLWCCESGRLIEFWVRPSESGPWERSA